MVEPGAVGRWSAKDVPANLADWEARFPVWERDFIRSVKLRCGARQMGVEREPQVAEIGQEAIKSVPHGATVLPADDRMQGRDYRD
jgi:hypothetical protein